MNTLPKELLDFLETLKLNNSRDWMTEHKDQYKSCEKTFKNFCQLIKNDLNEFDVIDKVKIFRIHRDVRFSKQKTPYNVHRSASWSRHGLDRRGSYYLRIEPGNSLIAGGFFGPDKDDLKRIRKEFEADGETIQHILHAPEFAQVFGNFIQDFKVKTAPKGFTIEHPNIHLIRLKKFVVQSRFSDTQVISPDFRELLHHRFSLLRPYFDYMSDVLTTDLNGVSTI